MRNYNRRRHRRPTTRTGVISTLGIFIVLALIVALIAVGLFFRTHFMNGTIIQGVDCSHLTVNEAKERIETEEVTLRFFGDTEYRVQGTEIGRHLANTNEIQEFLETQRSDRSMKEFSLSSESFTVDQDKVEAYLRGLDELKSSNMKSPKNAYLKLDANNLVTIVSEKLGNEIDFNEAMKLAETALQAGENVIDFFEITEVYPAITASSPSIISRMEYMNKVLGAEINLKLKDGSIYPLNNEITRTWIYEDEIWGVGIELDENLNAFIDSLNEKVQELGKTMEFETESHEVITVSIIEENRDYVDKEAEFIQLMDELLNGETTSRDPIYARFNVQSTWSRYIEVCEEHQHVYVYENGTIIRTLPCVTGMRGTSRESSKGVFYLILKHTNKHFNTYGGDSDYWMKYNKIGEGFHDANWQPKSAFGNPDNNAYGSHGCINLKGSKHNSTDAEWMYNYITKDIPIVVHK